LRFHCGANPSPVGEDLEEESNRDARRSPVAASGSLAGSLSSPQPGRLNITQK
jgi:hypothetical protein